MKTLSGLIIRPELPNDYDMIGKINDLAFGREAEGKLVVALRRNALFIKGLSLVALINSQLVGHILFFPVLIRNEEKVFLTLALAPMAVVPEYQRKGIGSSLINSGLDEARAGAFQSVIVLGHKYYYPGFGFEPASLYGIYPPFAVPDEVFLAMELVPGGLKGVKGVVEYPPEYQGV